MKYKVGDKVIVPRDPDRPHDTAMIDRIQDDGLIILVYNDGIIWPVEADEIEAVEAL